MESDREKKYVTQPNIARDTARSLAESRNIEVEINKLLKDRDRILEKSEKFRTDIEKKLLDIYDKNVEEKKHQLNLTLEILNLEKKVVVSADSQKQTIEEVLALKIQELKIAREEYNVFEQELALQLEIQKNRQDQLEKEKHILETINSKIGGLGKLIRTYKSLQEKISGISKLSGVFGHIIAAIGAMFIVTFDKWKEIDESLAKFRIKFGLLRSDSVRIRNEILRISAEFTHVGVTVDGVAESLEALADEFGGILKISSDLIETTALLKSQLGVSEVTTAGFLRNMAGISQSTAQSQKHMTWIAQKMTSAVGIPLNLVMHDVAKLSGTALSVVSKMPLELLKTAIAARQLGTTINRISESASGLLNFTESVQAEMEASVLLGRSINLQLARELTYKGKIKEANEEILKIAKRINFENLDRFQMDSFAAAVNLGTDEIIKMLQAQRQLDLVKYDPEFAHLRAELELIESLNMASEEQLKNKALQIENNVKMMANQARMNALQQQWNKFLVESAIVLYPVMDGMLKLAMIALKVGPVIVAPIYGLIRAIGFIPTLIDKVASKFVGWVNLSSNIEKVLKGISTAFQWILKPITKFGNILKGIGSFFSGIKFVGPFLKVLPVLGWIITGFQLLYSIAKNWEKLKLNPWEGLLEIGYDIIVKPFKDALDWIKSWWKGSSPSKVGWMIIDGISATQKVLFDVLTYPFRKFLNWLGDNIYGMGWISKKLEEVLFGKNKLIKDNPELIVDVTKTHKVEHAIENPVVKREIIEKTDGDKNRLDSLKNISIKLTDDIINLEKVELAMFDTNSAINELLGEVKWGFEKIINKKDPLLDINIPKIDLFENIKLDEKSIGAIKDFGAVQLVSPTERLDFVPALVEPIIIEQMVPVPTTIEPIVNIPEISPVIKPVISPIIASNTFSENETNKEPVLLQNEDNDRNGEILKNILKSLVELNQNLLSGKVAIYMDGNKLTTTLARQEQFRGLPGLNI
jgi:uncharacterized protein YoxC